MNPEFRRNVWLELTPLRLWALPLVVVALAIVVNAFDKSAATVGVNWEGLRWLGLATFSIFTVWGANKAAQSVTNEVVGSTWDWQRLAEHRPWELLLGKLFGSTVFEWYGAAFGLAVYAVGMAFKAGPAAIALDLFTLALATLFFHSLALFGSLAAASGMRATRRPTNQGARQTSTLIVLVLLATWIGPGVFNSLSTGENGDFMVKWWWTMPASVLMPLSLAMFIGWTLVGAHRLLRAELQEPVSPTPWIAYLLFLTLYIYPFVTPDVTARMATPTAVFFGVLAVVCGLLFYPVFLATRKDVVGVRALADAWNRGDGPGVWTRLPLWLFNVIGYAVAVAGLVVSALLGGPSELLTVAVVAASFGLFMLRDIGWILGVHLAPNPSRRPDLVVFFFLAVLYGLIPMLIAALGEAFHPVLNLFLPGFPVVQAAKDHAPVAPILIWALPGVVVAWAIAAHRLRHVLKP